MPTETVFYLEINKLADLQPKDLRDSGFRIEECHVKQYQYNRFLYEFIGNPWQWTDKLGLTDQQWQDYVADALLRTWVAYCQGSIAGYYELIKQGQDVEIRYFGLALDFIGKGWGGVLLTHAIRSGFAWGANRVWLHTCTKDHEHALANYQARGMTIYKTEVKKE